MLLKCCLCCTLLINLRNKHELPRLSNLLVSLGHTGSRRVVLGHTLNTQTLMKTDKQKKNKKGFK